MRTSILVLYFLVSVSISVYAQKRTFILLDRNDDSAVILAHVVSTSYRTVTDLNGRFDIPVHALNDSIRITNVGYEELLLIPNQMNADTLFLSESTILLNPVVITDQTAADILFDAVANTANLMEKQPPLHSDYWSTILEKDRIKGFKIASLLHSNNVTLLDTLVISKNCSDYEMESFSNANLIWEQNHVRPALSCLKPSNEELWNYNLTTAYDQAGYTEAKIEVDFISPKNKVEHTFDIWLNLDDEVINKIEFEYVWNEDQKIKLKSHFGKFYSLKRLTGTVVFSNASPVVISSTYTYLICDLNSAIPCIEHVMYHELKSKSLSTKSINTQLYQELDAELNCDNDSG